MAEDILLVAALLGLAGGCWMAWAPLGLIVPCTLVVGALLYKHTRPPQAPKRPDGGPPDGAP
jgi:hypothetical protein